MTALRKDPAYTPLVEYATHKDPTRVHTVYAHVAKASGDVGGLRCTCPAVVFDPLCPTCRTRLTPKPGAPTRQRTWCAAHGVVPHGEGWCKHIIYTVDHGDAALSGSHHQPAVPGTTAAIYGTGDPAVGELLAMWRAHFGSSNIGSTLITTADVRKFCVTVAQWAAMRAPAPTKASPATQSAPALGVRRIILAD